MLEKFINPPGGNSVTNSSTPTSSSSLLLLVRRGLLSLPLTPLKGATPGIHVARSAGPFLHVLLKLGMKWGALPVTWLLFVLRS